MRRVSTPRLSIEALYAHLHNYMVYDEEDGELRWKARPPNGSNWSLGRPIGYFDGNYYVAVVAGYNYGLHRLVWVYHHGYMPKVVDHIDGDRHNHRITNLRDVEQAFNLLNNPKTRVQQWQDFWLGAFAAM